ncbi:HEAT repeat protein [Promicromonospora sp. AC04]|uniref:HEAT repeat domain-containing protein n=1 Tax=Promicromonospora sp. AC04 TaxID=2135723 RepID=UPI000D4EB223|nr:HEAT repeat domain-containing protein [Promicromonospora sp. AC04]PUB21620.1 HEAT repeat protein [Promicromonospora sp. AC04]
MAGLTRLVPQESLGREGIELHASRNGWTLVDAGAQDGEPFEQIWVPADLEAGIHWVEDDLFKVSYLAVEGPDAERMVASLRAELPLHTVTSLTEAGSQGSDALMKALRMLGIQCVGQPFDADSLALLRRALADPEPMVRRTALLAASIMDWPELEVLLEHVSLHDDDALVRDEAAETLDILRARLEQVTLPR